MDINVLMAFTVFALVSSITPGPNNIMLMTSGANFGFSRTRPHIFGVGLGFGFMIWLVGVGMIGLFERFPGTNNILQLLSIAYLLFLAYKIASASDVGYSGKKESKPFTFMQAATFQWVNPKAWGMALTAISVYAPGRSIEIVLSISVLFTLINLLCISVWVLIGKNIQRFLTKDFHLRVFNYGMAALLILSVLPML